MLKRNGFVAFILVLGFTLAAPFKGIDNRYILFTVGLLFLVLGLSLQLAINYVSKRLFKTENWTITHEIVKAILYLLLLASAACYLLSLAGISQFSFSILLKFQFYTVLYGIIPVTISILTNQNKRLLNKIKEENEGVDINKIELISQQEKVFEAPISEIHYLKSDENYIHIISNNEPVLLRLTLKSAEEQLKSNGFLRVHRSYLINPAKIKEVKSRHLVLVDQTRIPISRSFRSDYVLKKKEF